MKLTNEFCIYDLLCAVYRKGAYSNLELDKVLKENEGKVDRAFVTHTFYGVLENEMRYSYAVQALTQKPPKAAILPILKMGMFFLEQTSVPDYAAIDKCVELTRMLGKDGVTGFINAVLRKFSTYRFPSREEAGAARSISFHRNVPLWLAELLLKQYDEKQLLEMGDRSLGTHIRLKNGFDPRKGKDLSPDRLGMGYFVTHSTMTELPPEAFTPQSLSSMVAVNAYLEAYKLADPAADPKHMKFSVLDLCAAPGGKAVYLKELVPSADVTACDLYPHRVELIRAYAKRMGVDIGAMVNDACRMRGDWADRFDMVICDVPCSGIGVLSAKPDIVLNRTPEGLASLVALQRSILEQAGRYVRPGGVLCYSTCTILREENEEQFARFLGKGGFESLPLDETRLGDRLKACGQSVSGGTLRLLPDQNGFDGFFIAAARRCLP